MQFAIKTQSIANIRLSASHSKERSSITFWFNRQGEFRFKDLKESKIRRFPTAITEFSSAIANLICYSYAHFQYIYKLTVGTQRVTSPIQLLKVPFKVLTILSDGKPLHELHKLHQGEHFIESKLRKFSISSDHSSQPPSISSVNSLVLPGRTTIPQPLNISIPPQEASKSLPNGSASENDGQLDSNSNPFPVPFPLMRDDDERESILDISLHQLDCLTARKTMGTYMITNPHGRVAKFCLLKSRYKLGEDIVGMFNFDEANVPCVQVCI